MGKKLLINGFRGFFTDIEKTHIPDSGFQELINFRLTKDRILEKIEGYKRYSDYIFDSTINHINQLIRADGNNLFLFSRNNIYRMDGDKNITILKENYSEKQTGEENNHFERVRGVQYQNKLWCVDKNTYPFFIYNLTDEGGFNLNIWAKVITSGANQIKIVDANDESIVYKIITISAEADDGTNLQVQYNDGYYIYITNQHWIFKFDYGSQAFDIIKYVKLSEAPILDWEFRENSFAIVWDGGGKELDYDFNEVDIYNNYWYRLESVIQQIGANKYTNDYVAFIWRGNSLVCPHYDISWNTTNKKIYFNFRIPFSGSIIESISYRMNIYDIYNNLHQIIFNANVNFDVSWHTELFYANSTTINVSVVYFKFIPQEIRFVFFKKDNYLYVGRYIKSIAIRKIVVSTDMNYDEIDETHSGGIMNESIHIKKYDIETLNEYDFNGNFDDLLDLKNIADIVFIDEWYFDFNYYYEASDENKSYSYNGLAFAVPLSSWTRKRSKNIFYNNYFIFKQTQQNQELFYPYILEYNSENWEVKMIGTPGRPYVIKQNDGNINGDYRFYVSFVTTQDGWSETFKSEPYQPPTFNNEKADLYWAYIPDDFPYDIMGLRIYAEDINTGEIKLIKEIGRYVGNDPNNGETADWQAKHIVIDNINPIESYFNIKPYLPKCHLITTHLERLVLANNEAIFYSQPYEPQNFPLENYLVISANDKDNITGLLSLYDRLYVFKNNYIYAVIGDLAQPQGILTVSKKYGCIAPDSIVAYKNTIIFLSYAGICILRGNDIIEVSRNTINKYLFNKYNINSLRKSFAYFDIDNKEYRLFIDGDIVVFNLNNDFYIEKKLDGSHLYGAVSIITEGSNRIPLFSTTQNLLFQDKIGNHFNGKKRYAYFKTKAYKLSDLEEKNILNLVKINGILNDDAIIIGEGGVIQIKPQLDNYYMIRPRIKSEGDIEFEFYEKSSWNCKLFDMELEYE